MLSGIAPLMAVCYTCCTLTVRAFGLRFFLKGKFLVTKKNPIMFGLSKYQTFLSYKFFLLMWCVYVSVYGRKKSFCDFTLSLLGRIWKSLTPIFIFGKILPKEFKPKSAHIVFINVILLTLSTTYSTDLQS